jgi:MFS family permease
VCGELGAVLGPVAGALLTGLGFRQVALAGAGVFVIALVVLYFCLPATPHSKQVLKVLPWWTTFRQPRFVAFIIAYSSWLLSYNQLYLALPVEIQRSGGSEQDLGPLFMLASVLIIAFQLPLARFARRVGAIRILPVGFAARRRLCERLPVRRNRAAGRLVTVVAFGVPCDPVNAGPNAARTVSKRPDPTLCRSVNAGGTLWCTLYRRGLRSAGGESVLRPATGSCAGSLNAGNLPLAAAGVISFL